MAITLSRQPLATFRDPGEYVGDPDGIAAYANARTASAEDYILTLGELTANLVPPSITPVFPTSPSAPTPLTTTAPDLDDVVWIAPSPPTAFAGALTIDDLMPDPFEDEAPELMFGTPPAEFTDPAPDAPGVNLTYEEPELTVDLPAPPSLLSLSVSAFSGVSLPTFTDDLTELTVVAPDIREYTPGSGYTSSLLTATQARLLSVITDGTDTGLPADVETALWDRGRDREYRQTADALLELDRMETLGYSFPPGVFLDSRIKIQTEMGYNVANISREIMVKQAELHLTNIMDAQKTAVQLEGVLINYTNSVEQRLFDSCKYATEAGIAVYNARVQAYAAYVDGFKARVAVYEAQVRGELARVEAYRAEIAAEEAKAQVNTALVNQYKVQVDAALSSIEIFKARIAGIQSKAEIEKLKVEIFGEQVRGYTARINAYTAGVEGFRAKVQAEGVKQDAFRSKVQAFEAQVSSASKLIEGRIAEYRGRVEAKTQEWDAYRAAFQGEAARAAAIASGNASLTDAFKSEVMAITGYNEVLTKQWQVAYDQAQRVAEIGVSANKANAELYMTTRSLALDAAKVGATVHSQLGASALSAINWSTSYSNAWSQSESRSESTSEGESTNTNYNYSV